jgi:hypothetical protein
MNIIPINPPIKTNKLITCLDNNGSNNGNDKNNCNDKSGNKTDTIKIDREKTDILLKFLLKSTEKEFYEKYNSPFFSGIPRIPLQIEQKQPSIDEDIKNKRTSLYKYNC